MRLILPAPELSVTPGEPTPVDVIVWNDRDVHDQIRVRAVGVEDGWSAPPQLTPVLAPDERHTVRFVMTLPEGFPAGGHACAFEAVSVAGPGGDLDDTPPVVVRDELTVRVEDLSKVSFQLEPRRVLDNGRFRVRIQNRSQQPVQLDLSARAASEKLRFRFRQPDVLVRPGDQVLVKAKIAGGRHLFGDPRKTSFTVVARGQSEPVQLSGTWERSAVLRPNVLKVVAVITVLAIWAASVGVGISWLRDRNQDEPVALDDRALEDALGGEAGGEAGSGTDGGSADGDDTGTDGPAGDPSAIEPGSPGAGRVVTSIGGVVEGPGGDGVNVQLRPVNPATLASPSTDGSGSAGLAAIGGLGSFASGGPAAKQLGRLANLFFRIDQMQQATTTTDGVWSFGGVEGPGFYELRFGKQGFSTKSSVVEIDGEGTPIRVDVNMDPAFGRIIGVVVDGGGAPIAGASIGVTDGLVNATTTSDGSGAFSVDGLTQDGHYTVSAAADGYGTGFARVHLTGELSPTVELSLVAGAGTIFGTVLSTRDEVLAANNGSLELADAQVTVTDGGEVTRTISTLDDGFFQVAGLPLNRPYTVRIEAAGHLTQIQTVTLTEGELELNVTLTGSSGRVQGDVVGGADDAPALNGVGVTLRSDTATFKTLTDANGVYDVIDVPSGDYTATFELFGYAEQLMNVTVHAGSVTRVDTVVMPVDDREAFPRDGSMEVTAFLADEPDAKLAGLSVYVNDELRGVTDDSGFLRIEGLAVGTAFLRISDLRDRPTVADFTRPVNIGEGGAADVQAGMRRLASLKGTVSGPDIATIGATLAIAPLPGIAICILPSGEGATYLDPTAGPCREDARLVDATTTNIDGTYEFEVVPSGTYDVVYQSVLAVSGGPTGVDQVGFLYQPTITEYSFSAGASREDEDVALNLYPVLAVEVSRPNPATPTDGDDLDDFVGVPDATLEIYDSGGTNRLVLLDPTTAAQDNFEVDDRPTVDGNGRIEVQVLTPDPVVTVHAVSPDPAIGRPIVTARSGEVNGASITLTADPNTKRNVAIPLITNESLVGSFEYPYDRFGSNGGFTDDTTVTSMLSPGAIAVHVTGIFDVFASDRLAPNQTSPQVAAQSTATETTTTDGRYAFALVDGDEVPAGATVRIVTDPGAGFTQKVIEDVAIPQLAPPDIPVDDDLLQQDLDLAADQQVRGVVRHLCSNGFLATGGSCPTGDLTDRYLLRPAEGVTVTLVPAADPTASRTTTTNAAGEFTFPNVKLGQHRIVVEDPDRIWHPVEETAATLKGGSRTTARVLADVTRDGVVYRLDDTQAAAAAYPGAITPTNLDIAGGPADRAYIDFIDTAEVTVDVANVNGIETTVELIRLRALDTDTDPCTAGIDRVVEETRTVSTSGALVFGGLDGLDTIPDASERREYFCAKASRTVTVGNSTVLDEDVEVVPEPSGAVRDGTFFGSYSEPFRPLTAGVSLELRSTVQYRGSVESLRGEYVPVTGEGSIEIIDVLGSAATYQIFDTLTADPPVCGTTSRLASETTEADGTFLSSGIFGPGDDCLRFSAVGHDDTDFPVTDDSGYDPDTGINDIGTVQLPAKKPDLTIDLVDTFGDPVPVAGGTVTLRYTPDGYDRAQSTITPTTTGTTSVTFDDLVPTIYELFIDIDGFGAVTKTVTVFPTDDASLTLSSTSVLVGDDPDNPDDIQLQGENQTVTGAVRVQYGAKFVDAPDGTTVSITRQSTGSADTFSTSTTTTGGSFSVSLPAGDGYTFTASRDAYDSPTSATANGVTVSTSGAAPPVNLVIVPQPRNVVIPLVGITDSLREMETSTITLEPDTADAEPGTTTVSETVDDRKGNVESAATFLNVMPGSYKIRVNVPNGSPSGETSSLPGYRDITNDADAAAFPPSAGEFVIKVPAGSADQHTESPIVLQVHKRLALVSGDGGTPIAPGDAAAVAGIDGPFAIPGTTDQAYYSFTVQVEAQATHTLTFAATGHETATIDVTADGVTPADQTVCLTKSAIPGNDGPDGVPFDPNDPDSVDDDVPPVPADDCSDVPGALTGSAP